MKTLKFKSNIMCPMCISKVSTYLDKEEDVQNWEVDLGSNDRILTVETSKIDGENIKQIVQKAGFKLEELGN